MRNRTRLLGKCVIITGGSRGLGHALVEGFLAEGALVATISKSSTPIEEDRLISLRGDLAKGEDITRLVFAALNKFGKIDVLINNAAEVMDLGELCLCENNQWERMIAVNLTAPFLLVREIVPLMKKRNQGTILNVSSSVAREAQAGWGPYALAKAGLDLMTRVLSLELEPWGIRVNTIVPHRLQTAMRQKAHPNEDPDSQIPPHQVLPSFVYLASDEASDITGQYIDLDTWTSP